MKYGKIKLDYLPLVAASFAALFAAFMPSNRVYYAANVYPKDLPHLLPHLAA